MKVKIENLEKGDEIIVAIGSQLGYLKILEKPRLSKKRVSWITKLPAYIHVMCSASITEKTRTYWYANNTKKHTYITRTHDCTSEGHNVVKKFNLNDKPLWLIKKGEDI